MILHSPCIQVNQLDMAVFYWYLVERDLSRVCYCTRVRTPDKSHFPRFRKRRICLNGHPVCEEKQGYFYLKFGRQVCTINSNSSQSGQIQAGGYAHPQYASDQVVVKICPRNSRKWLKWRKTKKENVFKP